MPWPVKPRLHTCGALVCVIPVSTASTALPSSVSVKLDDNTEHRATFQFK